MPTAASKSYWSANFSTATLESAETAGQRIAETPALTCPCDHLAAVGVELRLVQVGVRVEVHGGKSEGRNPNDKGRTKSK